MSQAPGIGDNSRHFGEVLIDEPEKIDTVLPDDHKKLFHFVKWHLGDYITGTQGMKLEHEGAYMRFLARLYDRGKPFPDDDKFMATVMGLSLRVWKRVKDSLISIGKIIIKCGCLTNARFERERQRRAAELKKQADAARSRWERERANRETSAKLPQNLAETSPKLEQSEAEKVNKNNDPPITTHMPTRDQRLETRKEDSVPNGTGASAPPGQLRDLIWSNGLEWLRPQACMNEAKLRNRIGGWIRDYGEGAVMHAISTAQAKKPVSVMSYIDGVLRKSVTTAKGETMAPWEAEQLDADRRASAAIDRLKAKYEKEQVSEQRIA